MKKTGAALFVTAVYTAVAYYIATPALNIHSGGFWALLLSALAVFMLLEAMGVQLREMFLNRRMAKCCGSEVFRQYAPDLARLTAEGRWDDMHRAEVKCMICANPQAYDVLRAAKPEGDDIENLFVLLDGLC